MKLEQQLRQLSFSGLAAALLLMVVPQQAFAMHIMEGFLPPVWALAWWLLFLPCLWYGLVRLRRIVQEDNHQKVLLAHGGLTTLGANGMSMAVIGPVVGYLVWKMACRAGLRRDVAVFLCAMLADLATYFVTSVQLGVAFPDPHAGATGSVVKFMGIFCLTQIPVAIAEGLLTVMIYDQLTKRQVITVQGH
ncbi:cobalamin biosynthesis protein CbiM [Salmonella enterica subsp. enterica serovar Dublin]|nr:cobalamin biosynthesis protein CbiM [Salmonella enterica subsp. enterica serovar Dublin]EJB2634694.1 cobalt ECF transporter S component CbiM [Salmonella enterica]ELD3030655.1 cobalt ECF transporter S component CbiM [Salmonella enterica]HAK4107395.1 cobalt ECF transporter S component CbiM [Salmonella enterica]HAK6824651.1 cobalt ECF transporter S component CbiM [Salmonella enterica]